MRILIRIAAIRPTFVDFFQLVLIVVQQILIMVNLMFFFRRPAAFLKEVDGRLQ